MSRIDFYIDTVCDDITSFDSGYAVFNEYLRFSADSAVVHYILDSESDNLIAYFSLISSAIIHDDPVKLNAISAIELKMFALDKHYQGANLSSVLLDAVIKTIQHFSNYYVGANVILLYSVPVSHIIQLYESKGFKKIGDNLTAFRSNFTEGCIPMYMAL